MVFVFVRCCLCLFFFFKQKTAYEMRISDWSSDVCSSDLVARPKQASALELQQLEQQAMLAAQPQAMIPGQPAEPTEYIDPMTSALMPQAAPMGRPQYGQPGASVSTFGGPDASGGR